jgi:apolipoprotein N-acyltransferase
LSLCIVALGQPTRIGWLGAIAATLGFALFFCSIPVTFSLRQRFFSGTLWFATVQLIQLSWMTSIEFQGYYILLIYLFAAFVLGGQFGLLTLFIPRIGKISFINILFCAALWTLMEWARLFVFCGFSWNPIGLALTHFTPSLQFASLVGVLGLSFWVMLTNLAAINVWRMYTTRGQKLRFGLTRKLPGFNDRKRVNIRNMDPFTIVYWVGFAALPYFFGISQLFYLQRQMEGEQKKFTVALVQTDLLPSQKNLHAGRFGDFISPFEQWRRILQSLREKKVEHWDLIVLPEAVVPFSAVFSYYSYTEVRRLFIAAFGPEVKRNFHPSFPLMLKSVLCKGKRLSVYLIFFGVKPLLTFMKLSLSQVLIIRTKWEKISTRLFI